MQSEEDTPTPRMAVLVRDPTTLFLYWDVDEAEAGAWRKERGGADAVWAIRLTNLEFAAVEVVSIHLDAGNWYIPVSPGGSYEIELGIRDGTGLFQRYLREGPVETPPFSYSSIYDSAWMVLEEDFLRLLALGGAETGAGASSTETSRRVHTTAGDAEVTVVEALPGLETNGPSSPGAPGYTQRA